jgi:hypothetical protein
MTLYVYGWNTPGYMPDFVSEEPMDWNEAREALLWEVERWDETDSMSSEQLDAAEYALKDWGINPTPRDLEFPCGNLNLFILRAED